MPLPFEKYWWLQAQSAGDEGSQGLLGGSNINNPDAPVYAVLTAEPFSFTGDIATGQPQITNIASTTGLTTGMAVIGLGIPASTVIISVDSSTQITLSLDSTNTATGESFLAPLVSVNGLPTYCFQQIQFGSGGAFAVDPNGLATALGWTPPSTTQPTGYCYDTARRTGLAVDGTYIVELRPDDTFNDPNGYQQWYIVPSNNTTPYPGITVEDGPGTGPSPANTFTGCNILQLLYGIASQGSTDATVIFTPQNASPTQPGLMSTGTQTFAGNKTWNGTAQFQQPVGIGATPTSDGLTIGPGVSPNLTVIDGSSYVKASVTPGGASLVVTGATNGTGGFGVNGAIDAMDFFTLTAGADPTTYLKLDTQTSATANFLISLAGASVNTPAGTVTDPVGNKFTLGLLTTLGSAITTVSGGSW